MKKIHLTKRKWRRIVGVCFAVVVIAGLSVLAHSYIGNRETLRLSPAKADVSVGSELTVTITENSNTTSVNAVEADLTYDQTKLKFVGIDSSVGAFSQIDRAVGDDGKVYIAKTSPGPLGGKQIVATVSFVALKEGGAPIGFVSTSGISASADGSDVLGKASGGAYSVVDSTAPATPVGLAPTGSTATTVAFAWTPSSDNVGTTVYKVYRGNMQIGTTSRPSYTDTGRQPDNTYSYRVAAVDAVGNLSMQSAALAAATTADTTAPSVPDAPKSTKVTLARIELSWPAATDNVSVTGYRIFRNGTQVGTSVTTAYTDTGLTSSTAYNYAVAAYDAAANVSAQSPTTVISTQKDTSAPTKPGSLTSPAQTTTSAQLRWDPSTDNVSVTGYRIFRNGTQVGTSDIPAFADTGLTPGTAYVYAVAAYDATGNLSTQSGSVTTKTQAVAGDANGDGHVDYQDVDILSSTWLSTADLRADFNHDGVVNYLDLSILTGDFGK